MNNTNNIFQYDNTEICTVNTTNNIRSRPMFIVSINELMHIPARVENNVSLINHYKYNLAVLIYSFLCKKTPKEILDEDLLHIQVFGEDANNNNTNNEQEEHRLIVAQHFKDFISPRIIYDAFRDVRIRNIRGRAVRPNDITYLQRLIKFEQNFDGVFIRGSIELEFTLTYTKLLTNIHYTHRNPAVYAYNMMHSNTGNTGGLNNGAGASAGAGAGATGGKRRKNRTRKHTKTY